MDGGGGTLSITFVAESSVDVRTSTLRILFLPGSYASPAARFRLWQFVEPLRALGHTVDVRVTRPPRQWGSSLRPEVLHRAHTLVGQCWRVVSALWILHDASNFDVIVMNRDIVPNTRIDFIEPWLARRNPRLIFDFDDAIHLGQRERKLRKILPVFAWITAGNEYLASFARHIHPNVSVWPTVVNTDSYQLSEGRPPGVLRIGWSGSDSTLKYCLPLLRKVIVELARDEDFEFVVIANVPPQIWPGVKIRFIPWSPATEVWGLQQIDIGLMPLRDEPFERGKCGLKAIQYMAVGVPAVVSPVGVNKEIVIHGETGFHCSSEEEWKESLLLLMHDEELRVRLGRAGRQRVVEHYSVASLLPKMIEVFEQVSRI